MTSNEEKFKANWRYSFGSSDISYGNPTMSAPMNIGISIPNDYVLDKDLHAKVESILDLL